MLGGGFAGLSVARGLAKAPVEVLLVDRANHHLFQPLLYQVATATLSPADIASPIRKILRAQRNAAVALAEASSIDVAARRVRLDDGSTLAYDTLVVATGAANSYFGNDQWAPLAPSLKTVEDALEIRRRFLAAFEAAEREGDEAARRRALTFVIVGAGPTGVELAGAVAEIARSSLPKDFRFIDTTSARVVLLEGSERVLGAYPEACSRAARRQLEQLGVEVRCGRIVTAVDERGVVAGGERIEAANVVWAAGVKASALGASLGAETDASGRVRVGPDLSVPGHPEVFVLGDLACVVDPRTQQPVPGVAPAAMQMGRHAARVIAAEAHARRRGEPPPQRPPFRYADKGSLATIGRSKAVAVIRGLRFAGLLAWLLWAVVHVFFLICFRNRLAVMFSWTWTYFFYDRGARLITGDARVRVHTPRSDAGERRAQTESRSDS